MIEFRFDKIKEYILKLFTLAFDGRYILMVG